MNNMTRSFTTLAEAYGFRYDKIDILSNKGYAHIVALM